MVTMCHILCPTKVIYNNFLSTKCPSTFIFKPLIKHHKQLKHKLLTKHPTHHTRQVNPSTPLRRSIKKLLKVIIRKTSPAVCKIHQLQNHYLNQTNCWKNSCQIDHGTTIRQPQTPGKLPVHRWQSAHNGKATTTDTA